MNTDRELLEAAAKAAGLVLRDWMPGSLGFATIPNARADGRWNPITDDGDALRLAVRLGLEVDCETDPIAVGDGNIGVREAHRGDPYVATRRAIVRAAAAMVAG